MLQIILKQYVAWGTDLRIMSNSNPFPWHYFIRTVRARILLVILSSVATYVVMSTYKEHLFAKVIIIIFSFIIISFIQGYLRIQPFRKTLAKIDEIQVQLPHNKKLNIIYQKNEWILIQEMLKLTEKYIREQNLQLQAKDQQSSTILEAIPDPLVVVDNVLNCKQYNTSFKESFIQSKEIKVFKDEKLWKVFEDDDILTLFQESQKDQELKRLNGQKIGQKYYNISITPILDSKNKQFGSLGLFHNVTESILTEKMRVDFVANVSHEIRTPLTSIKGFSQVLLAQKESVPAIIHKPLERIVYNTERLKDMFDNLLKLSVLESKFEISKTSFSLEDMITSINNNLKQKHLNKNFSLKVNSTSPIFGDKKLLEQVFTNLIDNSIKYNPKKDKSISVNSLFHENRYYISIQDNGQGIPEEDLKRIFERFYRIHGKNYQNVEGTGLGLSIVKHIINKHNGLISVESKINEGTVFKIELPNQ